MSRKHYVAIARILHQQWKGMQDADSFVLYAFRETVDNLCVVFTADNVRFDADRFRAVVFAYPGGK